MSINSMIFLTAFLPVVFVLDRLCVRKTALKNILLLLASLVFYAWGEPVYIVLLLVSIAANYGIGLLLGCQRDESVAAKAVLAAGILVNLGILGYYKYFDFFLRIVNRLTGSEHEMRNIPLPIGISFFTFGAISYLMDLYRGHYEAEKNPLNMALYLSFSPKFQSDRSRGIAILLRSLQTDRRPWKRQRRESGALPMDLVKRYWLQILSVQV